MPFHGKRPFVRKSLPPDVHPNDQVFYCKTTHEAFTNYDEFFERAILCSSMVWSCSVTGRQGLTFQEAIESEAAANSKIESFPSGLQLPVLCLMRFIVKSKFSEICNLITTFITNRYFVGEEINAVISNKKIKGRVVQVIAPDEDAIEASRGESQTISFGVDPSLYKYHVVSIADPTISGVVGAERVTRGKGVLSKDKMRLFMKQHIIASKRFQTMYLKESSIEKYNLDNIKWEDIFAGTTPDFDSDTVVIRTFNKDKKEAIKTSKKPEETRVKEIKQRKSLKKDDNKRLNSSSNKEDTLSLKEKRKKKRQEKEKDSAKKKRTVGASESRGKPGPKPLSPEDKKKKLDEQRKHRAEQKRLAREKVREEKKRVNDLLMEWNRKREDLECEDLVALPQPTPISGAIPADSFGDALLVLEFFHNFKGLFDLNNIFPNGITFELLERIIVEKDIHGPLGDFIKVLLSTVLSLQEEEESNPVQEKEKEKNSENESEHEEEEGHEKSSSKTPKCTLTLPRDFHGVELKDIDIDPCSVTEVLRLHLLSSGAGQKTARNIHRGWFSPREDPCVSFRLQNPHLLTALSTKSVFELSVADRLKVIEVLIHQIMTFVTFRDYVEDAMEKLSETKKQARNAQAAFSRWEKENVVKRNNRGKEGAATDVPTEAALVTEIRPDAEDQPTQEQVDEYKRERNRKFEDLQKKLNDLKVIINQSQALYKLQPIGRDRAYRRYWVFNSLPGVFVENDDSYVGECLPAKSCTLYNKAANSKCYVPLEDIRKNASLKNNSTDDRSTTSDKENESTASPKNVNEAQEAQALTLLKDRDSMKIPPKVLSEFDYCPGDHIRCFIHGNNDSEIRVKWGFYYKIEEIDYLLSSLNPRGFRESELREFLQADKLSLTEWADKCPAHRLNSNCPLPVVTEVRKSKRIEDQNTDHRRAYNATYADMEPDEALYKALQNAMIAMEENVMNGGLGDLVAISREEWKRIVIKKRSQESGLQLAEAISYLGNSVRTQYLSGPLEEAGAFERWQVNLLNCTSFSQLFVFLSTLEKSVTWTRSSLKANCRVCRRKGDAEYMLLCDACNRGHHTYCLQPPLVEIPDGEWYCSDCRPKFVPLSPRKSRRERRSYKEVESDEDAGDSDVSDEESGEDESGSSSENEVEEEDEEDDAEEQDEEEVRSNHERSCSPQSQTSSLDGTRDVPEEPVGDHDSRTCLCTVCHLDGSDVKCSGEGCGKQFHVDCHNPPLLRVPRGNSWLCSNCYPRGSRDKRKGKPVAASDLETEEEDARSKRRKVGRNKYGQDFDFEDGHLIDETKAQTNKTRIITTKMPPLTRLPSSRHKGMLLDYNKCMDVVNKLSRNEDGWPFLKHPKSKDAPNYGKVIKHHMDFGLVVSKLNGSGYQSNIEFISDIYLILQNCEFFYPRYSPANRAGRRLAEYFEELLGEHQIDPINHK